MRFETFADRLDGRDNFFVPIRLAFMFMVLIEHAWVVHSGSTFGKDSQTISFFGISMFHWAINGFFFMSGYLITQTWCLRRSAVYFAVCRIMRLYPAILLLIVCGLLVFGPLYYMFSPHSDKFTAEEYWTSEDLFLFPMHLILFWKTEYAPPGFGLGSPNGAEFSPPLWTMRFDAILYAVTPIAGLIAFMRKSYVFPAMIFLFLVSCLFGAEGGISMIQQTARLGFAFAFGAACFFYRDKIIRSWSLAIVGVVIGFGLFAYAGMNRDFLAGFTRLDGHAYAPLDIAQPLLNIVTGYVLLMLASAKSDRLKWTQNVTDFSYGTYIWHYPIYQLIIGLFPAMGAYTLLAIGAPLSVAIGVISFVTIETYANNKRKGVSIWCEERVARFAKWWLARGGKLLDTSYRPMLNSA